MHEKDRQAITKNRRVFLMTMAGVATALAVPLPDEASEIVSTAGEEHMTVGSWSGWIAHPGQALLIGHWVAPLPNGRNAISTTLGHVGVYRPFEMFDLRCKPGWAEVTAATPPRAKDAIQERARRQLTSFLANWPHEYKLGEYEWHSAGAGWCQCLDTTRR